MQQNSTKSKNRYGYLLVQCAVIAVMVFLLAACGTSGNGNTNDKGTSNATQTSEKQEEQKDEAEPAGEADKGINVKHEYGETVVPANPQRIVSIGMEDMLLSLDVPLVQAFSTEGYYLDKQIKDKGITINSSFDVSLEAIAAADPDLIIMNKYMTDEKGYEQLSKIAPTIAFLRDEWQPSIVEIGKALGKEAEANAIVATYQDKLNKAKASIVAAVGEDKTVAFIRPTVKEVELDFPEWVWTRLLYNDLGLKVDPKVLEIQKKSTDTWGGTMLSVEILPELTADYLFTDYGASMSNEAEFQQNVAASAEVEKLKVWQAIPAVKNGNAFKVSARHWALSGPIADSLKIDDVLQSIVPAK